MRTINEIFSVGGKVIAAVAVCAIMASQAEAQKPTPTPATVAAVKKMSYENFHMMQTRNIFDPDRNKDYVAYTAGPRPTPQPYVRSTPPPVQKAPDYVQLTGVMTTESETYAFFAGSQQDFNKVVPVNGLIAGATVTTITPSGIVVTRNGKQIGVPVGMTVPMDDTQQPGPPPMAGAATTLTSSAPASATTAAATAAPASAVPSASADPQTLSQQVPLGTTSPSGSAEPAPAATATQPVDNVSDAMRRMIERRQKELNNNP